MKREEPSLVLSQNPRKYVLNILMAHRKFIFSQEKIGTAGVERVKAEKKPVKKVKTEDKNPYHIIPGEVIDLT